MPGHRKGAMTQRTLVPELVRLIDDALAPNSTAHRDLARAKVRELLETTNWRTSYVLNSLNPRRCRYVASLGHWVPSKWLMREWSKPTEKADDNE